MSESAGRPDIEVWISNPNAAAISRAPGGFDEGGEVETHSKTVDKVVEAIKGNSSEFIESWKKACSAVEALFTSDASSAEKGSFGLESVTAKLSLTASGKVCFVGELGGEIAFEAVFKRRQ
jgi:hypothetical protein